MFRKFLIFLYAICCVFLCVVCNTGCSSLEKKDYSAQWNEAYSLYRAKKYEHAIDAFTRLAESTQSSGNKYKCYLQAAYSARNLKQYDKVIAFTNKMGDIPNHKYTALVHKMEFMNYARQYQGIVDEFKNDDIVKWPKKYIGKGLYYLGLAQYQLKKGKEAKKTFQMAYNNANKGVWKTRCALGSGHNYQIRLKDFDKAIEAYNNAINAEGDRNQRCTAREQLASIFIRQKKNDKAMAEYDKIIKTGGGYWKSKGCYLKGGLLQKMDKKEDALKNYKKAVSVKGGGAQVVKACETQIKLLEARDK